ncbi:MAG: DUF1932 domain-containing protein [Actinomycetota bacterium]
MAIGILHPGAMGASIGAALGANGHDVRWVSASRGEATSFRAAEAGMTPVPTVAALVDDCDTIISVCPPAAAVDVAAEVATAGFDGLYVDANAVSPRTARAIAESVDGAGARAVDGGIVGPPVEIPGLTVLYLSGATDDVDAVAALFAGTALSTHVAGSAPGAASAVKMAFAAWTKGTSALLLAIRALAESHDVTDGLEHAWGVLTPELLDRTPQTVRGTAPKAWRFVGEMEEIAATFGDAGLPAGFHDAAADIYTRLADLRDHPSPSLAEVLDRLAVD